MIKLLVSGGVLAGNARAKYLKAKRSALAILVLATAAASLMLVGVAAVAALVYLSLAPQIGAVPAASAVAAVLLLGGGTCGLLVYKKVKGVATATLDTEQRREAAMPLPTGANAAHADDPVASISRRLQSPYVISALVVGVLAGRHLSKK